jgi:hypothetical protein
VRPRPSAARAVLFLAATALAALGAWGLVHRTRDAPSAWVDGALILSFILLSAAFGRPREAAAGAGEPSRGTHALRRVGRVAGGVLLCACGALFVAMGVTLRREQPAIALLVCLGPGLAMLAVGARVVAGRPRRDGAYVHPVVRALAGWLFVVLGVASLAYQAATEGLSPRLLLGAVPAVFYVVLGLAIVRGRLLGPGPGPG